MRIRDRLAKGCDMIALAWLCITAGMTWFPSLVTAQTEPVRDISSNTAGEAREFNIDRLPLAEALIEFARQSDAIFVAPGSVFNGKMANSIRGAMTPQEALRRLLAGTGFAGEIRYGTGWSLVVFAVNKHKPEPKPEENKDMVIAKQGRFREFLSGLAAVLSAVASAPAAAQSDVETGPLEEVVVTGSRIQRRDYNSQSPLVTISSDNFETTSEISIDQYLAKLPQFGAGRGQLTDAGNVQSTPTSSPGIATINMRGLGSNRSLVLIDGRRTQPANASLVVDLNTIPAAAIDSVEIITGGAAATYGADAVAGVLNFKIKSKFDGAAFDAQYGATEAGDGAQTKISALLGGSAADGRFNGMLGLTYSKRDVVYSRDRDFYIDAWSDPDTAGAAFPYFGGFAPQTSSARATQAAVNSVFTAKGFSAGDVLNSATIYFNPGATTAGATLFSVAPGAVSGAAAPGYTGDLFPKYKYLTNGTLASNNTVGMVSLPLERYSIFASANYELNGNIELYSQVKYDQFETSTRSAAVPAVNQWSVTVPYDASHPVPAEFATLLDSRSSPTSTWTLNKILTYLGPEGLDTNTNTYEVLLGARGEMGYSDWSYDLFWSHGRTYIVNDYIGFGDLARYQALINLPNYGVVTDAITGPLTNFRLGRAASCTSGLNPFVTTPISQDCIDIISEEVKNTTDVIQDQVELNIQGRLLEVPAGEARFAAGADWRSNEFKYLPDSAIDTTNITSTTLGLFDTTKTSGAIEVAEVYGELLVPIVRDLPYARLVTLNAGYRYSDYDTETGGVSTWKTTGDWEVVDWFTIRGGFQAANRAPNVAELFQPPTFLTVGWSDHDPCSNITRATFGNVSSNPDRAQVQALCTALASGFPITSSYVGNQPVYFPLGRDQQQGNPALQPEQADTWTIGMVFRSPFDTDYLRNLTLAFDYYNISIDGAIAVKGTQDIYRDCFNADGTNPSYDPNYTACTKIIRSDTTGFWLATIAEFENLSSIATTGFDAQLEWNTALPEAFNNIFNMPGDFFANIGVNYTDTYEVQTISEAPVFDYADASGGPNGAVFKWKLFASFGANVGPVTLNTNWRHLPEVRNVALVTNSASTALPTPAYDLFDLSGKWTINETFEVRGGIDNLLDSEPPRVGVIPSTTSAAGTTDGASYDILGRRFYIGLRANF